MPKMMWYDIVYRNKRTGRMMYDCTVAISLEKAWSNARAYTKRCPAYAIISVKKSKDQMLDD